MSQDRFRLQVKTHFDAAHHLENYPGKCARHHGHRWEVEVVLEGSELDELNMLIDFGVVKLALDELLDKYLDHYDLNETLCEAHPTAEYLARWVYVNLPTFMDVRLYCVTVWESPDCCIEYRRGDFLVTDFSLKSKQAVSV